MKIKCIVIDDEQPAIEQMEEFISRVPFLNNLKSFNNAIEPMHFLKTNIVDLVFLDIEMEDFTGIQFIKSLIYKPTIILTTAYDQYAIEAFALNVTDYLLKPISFERFIQSIDKVHRKYIETENIVDEGYQYKRDYAFFKTEYKLQRIDFNDILYIEGMREYLSIQTKSGRILVLMSFSEVEEMLPNERFIRVHRSYIVSLDKIDNVEKNRIYMIDEKDIPVGNLYKETFFLMLNMQK